MATSSVVVLPLGLVAALAAFAVCEVQFSPLPSDDAARFVSTLSWREQVRVRIPVDAVAPNWVRFQLCDAERCGAVVVTGVARVGLVTLHPLRFDSHADCHDRGTAGLACNTTLLQKQLLCSTYSLDDGELAFVVERLPKAVAVWLQSCPDRMASAPVPEGSDRFSVATSRRGLHVQFDRNTFGWDSP